ncbi:MAG: DUF739 domain-containing protein [Chloroflexi bacterium]|nr:DUF739 domain-containing protein [Chloroflexota bacterium]
MIQIQKLKGLIVGNGLLQKDVAKHLGMSERTFYNRLKKGIFNNLEISTMVVLLKIKDPMEIFFENEFTQ